MKNIRLFWQIYPAILLSTILALIVAVWYIFVAGQTFYINQLTDDIKSRAYLIEPAITRLSGAPDQQLHNYVRKVGRRSGTRITLVNNRGVVLTDSNEAYDKMENHANRPELKKALAGEIGISIRFSRTLARSMLYLAIPTKLANGEHAALRLALSTASYEGKVHSIRNRILILAAILSFLAGLLALFAARKISRPLEIMKQGAEKLTKGRIDQLLKIESDQMSTEMAGLAGALNQMAEEINRRVRVIIQQRNELEAVFSSMADLVIAIDADQKILRMNHAASSLFSLNHEAVKGKPVHGIIRNEELLSIIGQALQRNTPIQEEITLFDGTNPLILLTHVVPLCDEGEPMGVLLIMHDLTKLNRLENIRQDFVANVSHELKTPVTNIKGYVETLLDGAMEDREDAQRFLTIISKQANRLDAIIDDLLALSRIENKHQAGEVQLETQLVAPVLNEAVQSCSVNAKEKSISIVIETDRELSAPINRPLLEQAIINLLNNAISYSPEASTVTLRSSTGEKMSGERFVSISVTDEGPGIAKEHLPRLFERFYRCDKARTRDTGGTGLGLAIVKHIANTHKGRVDVASAAGKGSTFTITIPAG